jgi:glycosyltransferase 2 family protein
VSRATPDQPRDLARSVSPARRYALKLVLSLLVAAGFAWLLHAGALPIWPDRQALAHVDWGLVGAYVLVHSLVHFLRAARWYFLIAAVDPVPMRKVLSVAFIGFLAIVALPFRTGEMVRPVLIRKKGLSGWAAMGTVAAERIIDGLSLSIVLFTALLVAKPLDPLPSRIGDLPIPTAVVPGAAYAALAGFLAAFVVMGVFYLRRAWARALTERVLGLVSKRFSSWVAERIDQVAAGLGFLRQPRYAAPFVVVTAAYWLLNAAASCVLARACGLDSFGYAHACVVMGVLALGILVPNAPGFFGAFQISIYAGLAMYFPVEEVVGRGAAFVFLMYVAQLGVTVLAAAGAMIAERTGLRETLAASEVASSP